MEDLLSDSSGDTNDDSFPGTAIVLGVQAIILVVAGLHAKGPPA